MRSIIHYRMLAKTNPTLDLLQETALPKCPSEMPLSNPNNYHKPTTLTIKSLPQAC